MPQGIRPSEKFALDISAPRVRDREKSTLFSYAVMQATFAAQKAFPTRE